MTRPILDRLTGALMLAMTLCVALAEWTGAEPVRSVAALLVLPVVAVLGVAVRWGRRLFIAVALGLGLAALLTRPDWLAVIEPGLRSAAFIGAFFTALATLRYAAMGSAAIATCGRFLAQQPPGRRYGALTVGGQMFGILLNYGALVLLGTLAEASARQEANAEIRGHRLRRMLLAIQRGFISTLPWSPLAFATAVSLSLVPGAEWADALGPCLVTGALMAGLGWAMDTAFKPRLSVAAPARVPAEGGWVSLWPLLALLVILGASVGVLHGLSGVRVVGVVMLVVPTLSLLWIAVQAGQGRGARGRAVGIRALAYLHTELPAYRGELVLLMMAGLIGTLGSGLLTPLIARAGIDLSAVPAWQILVALVWIIPATGQVGMNPILSVSLLAPLLPEAQAMGVSPSDIIVAITAGWGLSGASSPYTATTVLIGSFGGVSAHHVGLRWNGAYTLLLGVVLSGWVALVALY